MPSALADGLLIPPPTLLSGDNGVIASVPPPTLISGADGALLVLKPPTLVATVVMDGSILSVPPPTIVISAISGSFNTTALDIPPPTIAIVASSSVTILVANSLPPVTLASAALVSTLAYVSSAVPAPTALITATTGSIATALLTAVAPIMAATGFPAYTITVAASVPPPMLSAVASTSVAVAFRTWVLNTRKGALTEYGSEFAFNSYAVFKGQVLACGANGVVTLGTQSTDNGTAITALARTGVNDYDRSQLKRVPRIYTGYKTDGDLIFRTITSETGRRSYLLPYNHVVGFQQRRVPIGKGPKSTYWQYEWTNVNGSDFTVEHILAYPVMLRRRIQ